MDDQDSEFSAPVVRGQAAELNARSLEIALVRERSLRAEMVNKKLRRLGTAESICWVLRVGSFSLQRSDFTSSIKAAIAFSIATRRVNNSSRSRCFDGSSFVVATGDSETPRLLLRGLFIQTSHFASTGFERQASGRAYPTAMVSSGLPP